MRNRCLLLVLSLSAASCGGEAFDAELDPISEPEPEVGSESEALTLPAPVADLALGMFASCKLDKNGKVFCTGALDDDTPVSQARLITQAPLATAIAVGRREQWGTWGEDRVLVARRDDGSVLGFMGFDLYGWLASGSAGAVSLSTTPGWHPEGQHTCTVDASGVVRCWGNDGKLGSFGYECPPNRSCGSTVPVTIPGLPAARSVDVTQNYSCIVGRDSYAYCWGQANGWGSGWAGRAEYWKPTRLTTALVKRVGVGSDFGCLLTTSGSARCFGSNGFGGLGFALGTTMSGVHPVPGVSAATDLDVGQNHACAVLTDGRVRCWGRNDYGQLGAGYLSGVQQAVTATLPGVATKVRCGAHSTCALLADGSVHCWGMNDKGQLGLGNTLPAVAAPTRSSLSGAPDLTINPPVVTR